ncbi:uncharacterized protein LOC122849375 [Aphidius gifuensis]|uniref:uncharacterized protein LOC122849375 n=1 Tax=Aphidius gifuensis TaxID=684658 RepID=UPI001CDD79C8|nr:uncharacterized protein LOC122849375 [Aphidius gifuensis]
MVNSVKSLLWAARLVGTDVIFTIINYEELRSAIDHIHVYDVAAKFNNKYNNLTLIHCRVVGLIALALWLPVLYVSYKTVDYCPLLEVIAHYLFYSCITTQILLFYGFMMTLYQRFNHLSQLVVKKDWMMEMKIQTLSGTWDGLKLQNVWLMHSNLSTAAEKINNCYSVQLLLWIMIFSLSVLTRLYTIMNYKENLMYVIVKDTICGLGVFLNLVLIIFSCHITSSQANKIVDQVFSPVSAIQRHSNTIQIVSGMTTYLVILSKSS